MDNTNKILIVIVEDDPLTSRLLAYQLRSAGYQCQVFNSSTAFVDAASDCQSADLFVLDYDLGQDEPSGLELCRKVTTYFHKPVIMLTGNENIETLVSCLSAGADQYIRKPWDARELLARIEVELRKAGVNNLSPSSEKKLSIVLDDLITLDWDRQQMRHCNGHSVGMTDKELGIMELFISESRHYVDREHAFRVLYGYDMPPDNRSIDVLVSRVRKKICDLDACYRIKTMRGKGYQLSRSSENDSPLNS